MIEYVLIVLIALMIFLCFADFIQQISIAITRRDAMSLSKTRQVKPLKGEPK